MTQDIFFEKLSSILTLPPAKRHAKMLAWHTELLENYLEALRRLTPEKVAKPAEIGNDHRSILQVVAHIVEWERFILITCSEILSGVKSPRMLGKLEGYIDRDGKSYTFASIDEFNALQSDAYQHEEWESLHSLARSTAQVLYAFFSHPNLLNAERLEATRPSRQRIPNKAPIPCSAGWVLWSIVLEHPNAEHSQELGI